MTSIQHFIPHWISWKYSNFPSSWVIAYSYRMIINVILIDCFNNTLSALNPSSLPIIRCFQNFCWSWRNRPGMYSHKTWIQNLCFKFKSKNDSSLSYEKESALKGHIKTKRYVNKRNYGDCSFIYNDCSDLTMSSERYVCCAVLDGVQSEQPDQLSYHSLIRVIYYMGTLNHLNSFVNFRE